jgi:hypothetical protein
VVQPVQLVQPVLRGSAVQVVQVVKVDHLEQVEQLAQVEQLGLLVSVVIPAHLGQLVSQVLLV